MTNIRLTIMVAAMSAGCATPPPPTAAIDPNILSELEKARQRKPAEQPKGVEAALLPPLRMEMPQAAGRPIEPRFDLSVNNAPAAQVFLSIVSGTRYSMLVHPQVAGTISVNLKDVTIHEALESLREIYGYEHRIDGSRVSVQPAGLQTRIYRVNYLTGQRRGSSDLRVQSGSVGDNASQTTPPVQVSQSSPTPSPPPSAGAQRVIESSSVSTRQSSDFWSELRTALLAIVGTGEGRTVVVTPQSGVLVLRAFPAELRAVEQYLRESRLAIERQVMLEAKIIEVTLAEGYQSGINWAAYRNSGPNATVGQLSNASGITQLSTAGSSRNLVGGGMLVDTTERLAIATERAIIGAGAALATSNPASAIFGIALQTSNFAALLQFLETQGSVQVLSSPRVATINNQKAILKVGTDEFFVTNVSTVTTTTVSGTQQTPTVTVAPFFSGIVLDVTPQIDDAGNIMLHVHPSVSEVTESRRVVDLGGTVPSITLPLAKSTVSETDSIVRVSDGNIVAIGGLMSVDLRDNRGGLPGAGDVSSFLRNTNRQASKKELVILLKPTVIHSDRNWEQDVRDTQERIRNLYPPQSAAPRPQ